MSDKNKNAAIYSPDRKYRYALWRVWDQKKPLVMFVTLNPGKADENQADMTTLRCIDFAHRSGFGGVMLTNLFALRCDHPNDFINTEDPVGPDNDSCLQRLAQRAKLVIAAWGERGRYLDRYEKVIELMPPMQALGFTRSGQPQHMLAVRRDAELQPYPMPATPRNGSAVS